MLFALQSNATAEKAIFLRLRFDSGISTYLRKGKVYAVSSFGRLTFREIHSRSFPAGKRRPANLDRTFSGAGAGGTARRGRHCGGYLRQECALGGGGCLVGQRHNGFGGAGDGSIDYCGTTIPDSGFPLAAACWQSRIFILRACFPRSCPVSRFMMNTGRSISG